MAAVERNSDGSYDAVDSGGFGKDYHGQDVFGERIGGSHFGGFEEGHVGLDKDNTGHYEKLSSEALAQTESMPKSAFEADNSNESSEEEAGSGMRDNIRDLNSNSSEENNNVGSLDTSFQIGEDEDEKEKSDFTDKTEQEKSKELDEEKSKELDEEKSKELDEEKSKELDEEKASLEKYQKELGAAVEKARARIQAAEETKKAIGELIGNLAELTENPFKVVVNRSEINKMKSNMIKDAKNYGLDLDPKDNIQDIARQYTDAVKSKCDKDIDLASKALAAAKARQQKAQNATKEAKSNLDKYNSSFTDKTKEEEAKAGPDPNMSKASVGESDYLTKANKDSTKKVPKEKPSRNDYPNHLVDTFKGVVDTIADNTTAKALGIQSLEDFAKENGYDPNKLSTMKAYRSYQNKQIWKALPNLMKKTESYVVERIKDFFDPSQLPERIRNTLARYNAATLVGAAILSIQSGAGLQASIDQALTMVDPEDQPEVSDFLESVLNDEGTVADLSNAFDDALAPEQTSNTEELDESIVNIGRKDNTDYSDFNAGLGTSGTTSDADVKVFISRNVKADPVLRRMISKMGK